MEQWGGAFDHQRRRFHISVSARQRELHTLILSDGPLKHDSLSCVATGAVEEPAAIADALRGNQDPLCVQPIEQITESLPFLPDEVVCGHAYVIDEDLSGCVIHHSADGAAGQSVSGCIAHINQESREHFGALSYLLPARCAFVAE